MMKKYILLPVLFIAFPILSQNLSLNDLQVVCGKSNWEYVNQYLLNKGWEYYSSEKGSTDEYNTITWSFDKSRNDDKAHAWFYIYTYEGFPNKIIYTVFSKDTYQKIQNSLTSSGYKLKDNRIEDDRIINNYENATYALKITTQKREREEDYSFNKESFTAYTFQLIKKSGIYDPDNGVKVSYFDGSTSKEIEYTLKNGKWEGDYKQYFENGNLRKIGQFKNDKKEGQWKEYDENNVLTAVYDMKNDQLNGTVKIYKDGRLDQDLNYLNDKLNGLRKKYYYNEENVHLITEQTNYLNGLKHGKEELIYVGEEKPIRVLSYTNYLNDVKEGKFQKAKGDSLIVGNYKNDKLHGDYKIYIDFIRTVVGGIIKTDTTKLAIDTKGFYRDGYKNGNWKHYDLTGSLIEEGPYVNDKKNGIWLDYYPVYIDEDGEQISYSKELYLKTTYKDGKKNGKATRYSFIETKKIKCTSDKGKEKEECYRRDYKQRYLNYNYKDDKLNGPFVAKDSLGTIIVKGNYKDDYKEGPWLEYYLIGQPNIYVFMEGYYKNNERQGVWIDYIDKNEVLLKSTYEEGEFQGEYILYNTLGQPKEIKEFSSNILKSVKLFDSIGQKVTREYKILSESNVTMKVRFTQYRTDKGKLEIDYLMIKPESETDHLDFVDIFHHQINTEQGGYMDGMFLLASSDGTISMKGNILRDKKKGLWEFHYPEQNVKMIHEYADTSNIPKSETYYNRNDDTLFNGNFVYEDNETKTKEERRIRNGLRNGITQYYDAQGNKTIKEKYKDGILK